MGVEIPHYLFDVAGEEGLQVEGPKFNVAHLTESTMRGEDRGDEVRVRSKLLREALQRRAKRRVRRLHTLSVVGNKQLTLLNQPAVATASILESDDEECLLNIAETSTSKYPDGTSASSCHNFGISTTGGGRGGRACSPQWTKMACLASSSCSEAEMWARSSSMQAVDVSSTKHSISICSWGETVDLRHRKGFGRNEVGWNGEM